MLFIAAEPDNAPKNDALAMAYLRSFRDSGFPLEDITVWDHRNRDGIQDIRQFPVILLSGGSVPDQNDFFREIGLKEKIAVYSGVVIGVSAGTMNCAETVYVHPESPGETRDFCRFRPGLGLTNVNVIPHYEIIKHFTLDGLRLMEDVAYPDSMGRRLYAMNNGSYILSRQGREVLYGECYRIENGHILKICSYGESLSL